MTILHRKLINCLCRTVKTLADDVVLHLSLIACSWSMH